MSHSVWNDPPLEMSPLEKAMSNILIDAFYGPVDETNSPIGADMVRRHVADKVRKVLGDDRIVYTLAEEIAVGSK